VAVPVIRRLPNRRVFAGISAYVFRWPPSRLYVGACRAATERVSASVYV
jgi:hypothetical protein